ncbi:hypothetical protein QEM13_001748 [Pseudomonas putida]|nr:hypothetical protein [Pseudomonas putida]
MYYIPPLCTRTNPWGENPRGLLGKGELPWPELVAARAFPSLIDIEGWYNTDDYSAAMFLANELAMPDAEMSADEAQESLTLLLSLFARLENAGRNTVQELEALRERAESIPTIGPLWFSPASLPSTLGTVIHLVYAASNTKRLIDLLDLPEPLKKDLKAWAAERGRAGSRSARKSFRRRIKLVHVGGALKFQVPVMKGAAHYNFGALRVGNNIHMPAHQAQRLLNSRVGLDPRTYGSRGFAKIISSNAVGALLSFGPQAYIDARASHSLGEFWERSAYSQSANAAAFAGGVIATVVFASMGLPLVMVIGASFLVSTKIQHAFIENRLDRAVGDALTKGNM